MKKKILISFFWFLIAAVLMSPLGQSQVIANDDSPEQEAASSPGPAYLELGAIPAIDELGQKFVDEIPELAMGDKRIVYSGYNFQPFNRSYNVDLRPFGRGCMGYYLPSGTVNDRITVMLPIWMPIGSKITGLYWTGVDWITGSQVPKWSFVCPESLERAECGLPFENWGPYFSPTPFNKYVLTHTVQAGWSYQVLISTAMQSYACLSDHS